MNFKYKVGDKVRILSGAGAPEYFCGWARGMNRYVGKVLPVLTQNKGFSSNGYKLDGGGGFIYDERYLSKVKEKGKPRIVVYIDKEDFSVVVAKDTETGKTGKAKCSPEDTFDFYTGAQLAMMRLFDTNSFPDGPKERRLRVGDYIVGNEKNPYAYTSKGTVWRVVSADTEGGISIECPSCSTIFPVEAKYFDLYTGPLFNGDVVCVEDDNFAFPKFVKGKIYHIEDGGIKGVDTHYGYVASVDALNDEYNHMYKFVEIVK